MVTCYFIHHGPGSTFCEFKTKRALLQRPYLLTRNLLTRVLHEASYHYCQYSIGTIHMSNFLKVLKSQEISNLLLANREARYIELSDSENSSPNQWAAETAAHQNLDGFSESDLLEGLYDRIRTHFIKNS